MKTIEKLELDVLTERARFKATAEAVGKRLTLHSLADDLLDPQLTYVQRANTALKRNPLLAAGVFAGASWLLSEMLQNKTSRSPKPASSPLPERKKRQVRTALTPEEESAYGNNESKYPGRQNGQSSEQPGHPQGQ